MQMKAMREIARLSHHAVTWFLTRLGRDPDIGQDTGDFGDGIRILRKDLAKLATPDLKQAIKQRMQSAVSDGLPQALAEQIAVMPILSSACDIVRIALEQKTDLSVTARTYFQLGARFHMDWLRRQARFLPSEDYWDAEATAGLVDQLYGCQAGMTVRVLADTKAAALKGEGNPAAQWLEKHADVLHRFDPLFADLRQTGTVDLPMLVIAEQRLRSLCSS